MDNRLPAHLEVAGLIRAVEAAGGFGMVNAKGEKHAGTLLVICCEKGTNARAYERMPQADGQRKWVGVKVQDTENPQDFWNYCARRSAQDPDLWVVELDVGDAERFIPDMVPKS